METKARKRLLISGVWCGLAFGLVLSATPLWAGEEPSALSGRLKNMTPEEQLEYLRGGEAGSGPEVLFQLGNTFFALEQLDSAIVYYGHAIAGDSSFVKAWVNMGLAYDAQKQTAAAQRSFEQALEVDPNDVLAICHLGFTYFNRGQVSKAIEYYQRALRIDPDSAQAHYNLGLAFADARIFAEALREWERVIELDDGDLGKTAAENVELIHTYMELDEN